MTLHATVLNIYPNIMHTVSPTIYFFLNSRQYTVYTDKYFISLSHFVVIMFVYAYLIQNIAFGHLGFKYLNFNGT